MRLKPKILLVLHDLIVLINLIDNEASVDKAVQDINNSLKEIENIFKNL